MVISRRSLSAPYEYKWSVLEMSSGPHETTWRRKLARAGAHDTRRCTCPSQHAGVKEKPVLVGISIGRIAHVKAFFVHFLMSLQQAASGPEELDGQRGGTATWWRDCNIMGFYACLNRRILIASKERAS